MHALQRREQATASRRSTRAAPPPPPLRLSPLLACDPATAPEVLWFIAEHEPALRRWLVANPSADAALLEYVAQAGGHRVEGFAVGGCGGPEGQQLVALVAGQDVDVEVEDGLPAGHFVGLEERHAVAAGGCLDGPRQPGGGLEDGRGEGVVEAVDVLDVGLDDDQAVARVDRKSTRLNSSHT